MATSTRHQIISRTTIDHLTDELKTKLTAIDTDIGGLKTSVGQAFKGAKLDGNAIKLYTTTSTDGTEAAKIDLPVDMVLDQTKTKLVENFSWDAGTYGQDTDNQGSALQGKPVLVLAVKGENGTTKYSFLNMEKLVDTYTGKSSDKSATVTVSGYEIDVKVNISTKEGNQLKQESDGSLFVPAPPTVDLTDYAKKPTTGEEGNIVVVGADGDLDVAEFSADDVVLLTDVKDYTAAEIKEKLGLSTTSSGGDG